MMIMKKYIWVILILFCFVRCESLEDTYSDYAGDGPQRYLGMCTNMSVAPGWEKLLVSWDNAVDPVVKNIKITWTYDGISHDTLLPKEKTSCVISRLKDANYEIKIVSVDDKGNFSFENQAFGRPYTMTHEAVIAFPRIISKHFFVGEKENRLVLFFNTWDKNIHEAKLSYTSVDGTSKSLDLKAPVVQQYYLLPDEIDPTKKVRIERSGYIDECEELITFEPIELTTEKSFTSDTKLLLRRKYGQGEKINDEFVENQEELEIDYSLNSFEDILYFSKLKKLYLGKNRFLHDGSTVKTNATSEVFDKKKSLFALQLACKLLDLEIVCYNNHYITSADIQQWQLTVTPMGSSIVPDRNFYSSNEWSIESSVEEDNVSNLGYIIDNNVQSFWQAPNATAARLHELKIDMKELKTVSGLRIHQKFVSTPYDQTISLLPDMMVMEVSEDGIVWSEAPDSGDYTLGNSEGEITDIVFSVPVNARYVKLIFSDYVYNYGTSYSMTLSEVRVF